MQNFQTSPQTSFFTFDPRYFSTIIATSMPIKDTWRHWIADNKIEKHRKKNANVGLR